MSRLATTSAKVATVSPLDEARTRLVEAELKFQERQHIGRSLDQTRDEILDLREAVAALEATERDRALGPIRDEFDALEHDDREDAARIAAAIVQVLKPIVDRMRNRFERRQHLAMKLGVGATVRHARIASVCD
jgi:hypothetical protein